MMTRGWTFSLLVVALATGVPAAQLEPLHPPVPLLDRAGDNVLRSGQPVSTMTTCGKCHDTQYIAAHSYHAAAGCNERFPVGSRPDCRAWDYSPGQLGRWNPLRYRYASPPGDVQLDLGIAEWIQVYGERHVGGGPAVTGFGTVPLDQPRAVQNQSGEHVDPERDTLDPQTRKVRPWDWQASGVVEMNCFLCHIARPDNGARIDELRAGHFQWAGTATLQNSGAVRKTATGWEYVAESFLPDATLAATTLGIQAPTSEHCGQCHGQTHFADTPLILNTTWQAWSTLTKGQVFSPQLMRDSAVNLAGKAQLNRPWDVHAASMLECTSCHFALNDPKSYEPTHRGRPRHLRYEPRRLDIGQYLVQPSHQFAKGQTAQGTIARHLGGTMRRCEDCHDAQRTHDWLPYRDVHFARLTCEACHIPRVYAPALEEIDWTLVTPTGDPRVQWRGVEGRPDQATATVTGYEPVLVPRRELDGSVRLAPHNLLTAWYWVQGGAQPRPVRLADLRAALFDGDRYHPDVLAVLDIDRDGDLAPSEMILDEPVKIDAVRKRLEAVGVTDPRIKSEIQPLAIHHGVGPARGAVRQCDVCHADDSRLARPLPLTVSALAEVQPQPVRDAHVSLAGDIAVDPRGGFAYHPDTRRADLYVLGYNHWSWIDFLGAVIFLAVVLSIAVHTMLRILARRRTA